jgi:putative ABC transport system permease protein
MQTLLQDTRFGVRMLLKKPGFTAVAIAALALGIGANTAIFSAVNAVLLRPLPYSEPEQLVWIWENNLTSDIEREPASFPNFSDWRNQNESFEDMAAFTIWLPILTNIGEPERIPGGLVSASLFSVLRAEPMLGRTFSPEEDRPGKNRVVVLSYRLWQRRFASDKSIIEKTIMLNGYLYTVVGVMPPSFEYPTPDNERAAELWSPLGMDSNQTQRRQDFLNVIARLKPSVSLEQARAEIETIASRLAQQYQDTNSGWGVTIIPLHERFVGEVRPAMLMLVGTVGFLLLIACVNVANLLLARSTIRRREVAIRTALGASRGRLIRQFLTESLLLAFVGGAFGVLLAHFSIRVLTAFSPSDIPRINEAGLDLRVLGFTLLTSILTGVIFGLVPSLQASRIDLSESLKEGSRGSTEGISGRRIRSLLAVLEVALALVLLIGSGLMVKSFARLQRVDPGFFADRLLTMQLFLPRSKYVEKHQVISFLNEVIERVGGLPDVQRVAAVSTVPLSGRAPVLNINVEGHPPLPPGQVIDAEAQVISPSYFETMGIPLLRGRLFTDRDNQDAMPVVVINDAMARRYWPGEDPIGKRISAMEFKDGAWLTVAGIVGDVRHVGLHLQPYPQVYISYMQNPHWATSLIVRTISDPAKVVPAIRGQMNIIDRDQPLYNVRTMNDVLSNSISRPRFNTQLISILTAVALVLTAVGIYGVISYSVSQRYHEIGVRIALGARQRDILFMIIGHGLKLALIGIAVGLAAAFALSRLMTRLLYGVSVTDPLIFIGIPAIIAAVVVAACYIPARRATKIDPMVALRYE